MGPITASAVEAKVPDATLFRHGRLFSAWLGLTPRQHSTGGKTRLGASSKRGDAYLRGLLVNGARSAADSTFKPPALALFTDEGRLNFPVPGLPALFTSSSLLAPDLPDTTTPPESPALCRATPSGTNRPKPAERQLGLMLIRGDLLQTRQSPRNHLWLFDARDHLERAAAARAGVDLDAKGALQALRLGHRHVARGDGLVGIGWNCLAPHAPMRRCHRCSEVAVRREHPMKSRQMHPRRRHQRGKPCHQVQRFQHDVRGAVAVGGPERLAHLAR